MTNISICSIRDASLVTLSLLSWQLFETPAEANPLGGIVTRGGATFNTAGSVETITTSSPGTVINWNSFNINVGETTTFVQPSSSSVVWNNIGGNSASQILGNLNANGYVILANQSGFYVGGTAAITAHGLIMTTAACAAPNLSSGGSWDFNAPPPTAQIINYGQINITGGGSVFLIANNIINEGTGSINAENGNIGLYSGKDVLVSFSPDGRGLSAKVTLPQGSVDNEGHLLADGGTIAAQAQTINQNGTIQANSVQNINGEIELVASDSLTLGDSSDIEANGDSTSANPSQAGFVVLQSGNTYADSATSVINVAGQNGGQDGIVEIFGQGDVLSGMSGTYATLINPYDMTLSYDSTDPSSADLNIAELANYSKIDLRALDNIELTGEWFLTDPGAPATLSLQAGNSITLDDGTGINADNNWNVNLSAGMGFIPSSGQLKPTAGNDGIYLNGSSYIQTQNGDIDLWAANEVLVNSSGDSIGLSGIRTLNGGNITVNTQYGDVNSGLNPSGYVYDASDAPYYTPIIDAGDNIVLGGISTAAGGNVTINAGGNVFSFLPSGSSRNSTSSGDAGTGAFGPEAGNVTITAGGSIYGHYVLANGVGSITAGKDVGAVSGHPFALSLIDGSWSVNAAGTIYLQEVRNPNGVLNNMGSFANPGNHFFDYAPDASVSLNAYAVFLTSLNVPRPGGNVPVLYAPILNITAGAGGVTLQGNVTLFPSPDQNLQIVTTDGGNLMAQAAGPLSSPITLFMSDSTQTQWKSGYFIPADHGTMLTDINDPNPVFIDISGSMENLNLVTSKATQLTVDGDMINCGFSGENLHASDVTSLTVGGQIFNQSAYTFLNNISIPSVPAADLPPGLGNSWNDIFTLALDPTLIASFQVPSIPSSGWAAAVYSKASAFPTSLLTNGRLIGINPGFTYDAATGKLSFGGPMAQSVLSILNGPITVLRYGSDGLPVTYTGSDGKTYFATDTINWAPPSAVQTLFANSQQDPSPSAGQLGYRIGGPGEFDINAGSISLGNSYGILSCGAFDSQGGYNRYANLASITPEGADVNVTVAGDLTMLTSTIATLGGGNVNVTSTGGSMDLGAEGLLNSGRVVGYGVFSSGGGDVNVISFGDLDINGSRIATYNGGNIFVESLQGNVDVGTGGNTQTGVAFNYINPITGLASSYDEIVFGNGIVANTLVPAARGVPFPPANEVAALPGNITVLTPQGNITASLGGITQQALDGSSVAGPTITLVAGTQPSGTVGDPGYFPGYVGNIDLGQSGVIGGTVNATANGNISGLIISRQNSNVNASQNFSGSVLAGGSADVSGGGSVSGTIVGVGGASVSGGSVTAAVLGQNVSVNGGASQSTLGTSAAATSTSQSAAQQSSNDTKQQLANTDDGSDDDKKKKIQPLMQRVKRVTVILPKASAEKAGTPQG